MASRNHHSQPGNGIESFMDKVTPSHNHKWIFRNRFFRRAFGPRVQPAVKKIGLAVAEIRKISTKDPVLAADGAVLFLQRISPALESSDLASSALLRALEQAMETLFPLIARAETSKKQRKWWLKKLFEAYERDQGMVLEAVGDRWGELCGSKTMAWDWADRLLVRAKPSLDPDLRLDDYFHGTTACLSALFAAGRYQELVDLVGDQEYWRYRVWAARSFLVQGNKKKAMKLSESALGRFEEEEPQIQQMIEEIRRS